MRVAKGYLTSVSTLTRLPVVADKVADVCVRPFLLTRHGNLDWYYMARPLCSMACLLRMLACTFSQFLNDFSNVWGKGYRRQESSEEGGGVESCPPPMPTGDQEGWQAQAQYPSSHATG